MKVIVNEKALIEAMEDLTLGTEEVEGDGVEDTDREPIIASPVMSTQLAVDRPPVGDPDFMPTSIQQLSRSASTLSEEVPQDQIDFFYRKLHDLLDQALDRHDNSAYEENEPTEEEEEQESLEAAQEDIPDEEDAILESIFKKAISLMVEQEDIAVGDDEEASRADAIFESRLKSAVSLILEDDDAETDEDEDDDYDYDDEWTEDEIDDIESTVRSLMTHFEEQEVGYEAEEHESQVVNPGMKWKDPMRPEKMKIDLARALVYDQRSKELLGGLTPEIKGEVIKRIHARYRAMWSDLFASPEFIEQLEFNKEVDMEAREMLKDSTNDQVIAYLLSQAEAATDPRRKKAYLTIAELSKKGAVADTPTWDRDDREGPVLTPEQQAAADLEKAERDLKKLDSLAPYFGFKNASGIRQWRRKFAEPKFKALIGSMTGVSAYGDYSNKIMDNMAALLDEFASITEKALAYYDSDPDDLDPGEEDFKEGLVHINDQFQAMLTASLDDENGHIPADLLQGGAGYILRLAFSDAYFNKQFRDFAKQMKDHIVLFLKSSGVSDKIANKFAKMFNGEVDLVTLNSDSAQSRALAAGGITPEIYKATVQEEQNFIVDFFSGDYQKKSDKEYLARLRDKKYLVRLFEKSVDESIGAIDMEDKLDQALDIDKEQEGDEETLEENLKKMINTIMRM